MRYYPIYLNLQSRRVLVVGGGAIAAGKTEQLLASGAKVTVVSPVLNNYLQALINTAKTLYELLNDDIKQKLQTQLIPVVGDSS